MWGRVKDAEGLEIAEIRNSETVQANRKMRSELAAQYQQKLNVYKPSYPEMQQLRSQIEELDAQLAKDVNSVKADIKSSYEASKISVAMLEAELEKSKTALVQQRNRSIQYNILQREVDTNRQLYDGLLQRYKEIGVAGGIGTNNISFVDKATLPGGPSSPNVEENLMIGLMAGLALGFMLAFGLDFLDETLKVPEDIEAEVGLPVMGVVPLPKKGMTFEASLLDPAIPNFGGLPVAAHQPPVLDATGSPVLDPLHEQHAFGRQVDVGHRRCGRLGQDWPQGADHRCRPAKAITPHEAGTAERKGPHQLPDRQPRGSPDASGDIDQECLSRCPPVRYPRTPRNSSRARG